MIAPSGESGDGLGLPLALAIAARRRFSDEGHEAPPCEPYEPYEKALDRDPEWAMSQGSQHFEERSRVFQALHKIAERLSELNIPYAVVGGMALFRHGFRRFTEDVDILVTKDNLKTIHEKLAGLGYRPPHTHSKHLRDTEFGVRIEFLTSGDFPGDGKPKPVPFPDPGLVSFEAEGIQYIRLEHLIELKLASGMTNAGRLKDLADVLALVQNLNLTADYSEKLHPYVREKFLELVGQSKSRYVRQWPQRELTPAEATLLDAMLQDGVILEAATSPDGPARLVTTDLDVARRYDMIDESEFWVQ